MAKPVPMPIKIVCSECGLSWEKHEKATLSECIRLLRAELARRPQWSYTQTYGIRDATVTYGKGVVLDFTNRRDEGGKASAA